MYIKSRICAHILYICVACFKAINDQVAVARAAAPKVPVQVCKCVQLAREPAAEILRRGGLSENHVFETHRDTRQWHRSFAFWEVGVAVDQSPPILS